jgi:ABC-type glycerol-3-phosphate transport system permease component
LPTDPARSSWHWCLNRTAARRSAASLRPLDSFIGQYTVDWQHLFGASVVATIPVLILFAVIERRVVGGLTAGSIK